jgi:F-type H+-transporting ATPase subunit delta
MQNPRLATRYAQSLLDLAIEQNALDSTLNDIQTLESICQSSRDFANMLRSPIIKADKKNAIINAVVGNNITALTKAFINLLTSKGREEYLVEIIGAYIRLYKELKKIKTVRLTTASPVTDVVKNAILQKLLGAMPQQSIDLKTDVNPDLIGGFVLQMDDKLYDASVRHDLNVIKSQFTENLHVSKLN